MGTPEQHTQTAQYARNFIHHHRKSHRHLVVQLKPRVGWRQQRQRCWCKQRIRIVLLVQGPKTSLTAPLLEGGMWATMGMAVESFISLRATCNGAIGAITLWSS